MTAGGSLFNNFSFDCRVNIHLIDWKYIHCVRDCANEEKDRDEERAGAESCCVARRRRQTLFEVVRSYAVSVAVALHTTLRQCVGSHINPSRLIRSAYDICMENSTEYPPESLESTREFD